MGSFSITCAAPNTVQTATSENIQLRFRAHNVHEGELFFGRDTHTVVFVTRPRVFENALFEPVKHFFTSEVFFLDLFAP